jgi:hypothetical protein
MYYRWPHAPEAYAPEFAGQYMFGPCLLAAPVARPASNATRRARKSVWLPPRGPDQNSQTDGASGWVRFAGGEAAAPKSEWALEEIPLFAEPGALVPMRTPASTRATFVDPVVWTAWTGARSSSGRATLYEDGGDGLPPVASASTEAAFAFALDDAAGAATATLDVGPTRGGFSGSGDARRHRLQLRRGALADGWTVEAVAVRGAAVPRVPAPVDAWSGAEAAVGAGGGWYIALAGDGRDALTEPEGALVVVCGAAVDVADGFRVQVSFRRTPAGAGGAKPVGGAKPAAA